MSSTRGDESLLTDTELLTLPFAVDIEKDLEHALSAAEALADELVLLIAASAHPDSILAMHGTSRGWRDALRGVQEIEAILAHRRFPRLAGLLRCCAAVPPSYANLGRELSRLESNGSSSTSPWPLGRLSELHKEAATLDLDDTVYTVELVRRGKTENSWSGKLNLEDMGWAGEVNAAHSMKVLEPVDGGAPPSLWAGTQPEWLTTLGHDFSRSWLARQHRFPPGSSTRYTAHEETLAEVGLSDVCVRLWATRPPLRSVLLATAKLTDREEV
jgi:hypothetical protein